MLLWIDISISVGYKLRECSAVNAVYRGCFCYRTYNSFQYRNTQAKTPRVPLVFREEMLATTVVVCFLGSRDLNSLYSTLIKVRRTQMMTHSTGVYITVNSYSLDAHLLARLDHLMEKKHNINNDDSLCRKFYYFLFTNCGAPVLLWHFPLV